MMKKQQSKSIRHIWIQKYFVHVLLFLLLLLLCILISYAKFTTNKRKSAHFTFFLCFFFPIFDIFSTFTFSTHFPRACPHPHPRSLLRPFCFVFFVKINCCERFAFSCIKQPKIENQKIKWMEGSPQKFCTSP